LGAEEIPRSATPLSVEPQGIDFNCLKPGDGANTILRVSGGPGQVIVHSDRLRVTPASFGSESTELRLTLLGGSVGELIWDDILLQGDDGELKVLVTARWEEVITPKPKVKSKPKPEPMPEPERVYEPIPVRPFEGEKEREIQETEPGVSESEIEKRTFRGRTCRWCGKNIRYGTNSHSWKECDNCKGARIIVSAILRISREAYFGTRELRPSLAEIWDTLLGKEEKRR